VLAGQLIYHGENIAHNIDRQSVIARWKKL
jgi:hypothetical protein